MGKKQHNDASQCRDNRMKYDNDVETSVEANVDDQLAELRAKAREFAKSLNSDELIEYVVSSNSNNSPVLH